jgi:hypothetical protein
MHDLRLGTSMEPYLSTSNSKTEGPSMLSKLIPILVSASQLLKNLEHRCHCNLDSCNQSHQRRYISCFELENCMKKLSPDVYAPRRPPNCLCGPLMKAGQRAKRRHRIQNYQSSNEQSTFAACRWSGNIINVDSVMNVNMYWACMWCCMVELYLYVVGWLKYVFCFYNAIANGGKLCGLIVVWAVPCKARRGLNVLWAGLCIARLGLICQKMVLLI